MKTAELRKKDKKELERSIHELTKKLSDLRFKFSSGKLKNVKEITTLVAPKINGYSFVNKLMQYKEDPEASNSTKRIYCS